jgi:hypothetical protein
MAATISPVTPSTRPAFGVPARRLPWASIAGFADVLGLMALVIWLAYRHRRSLAQGGTR